MSDDEEDPNNPSFEFERVQDPTKMGTDRQVSGVLDRVAEAEIAVAGLHVNHKVTFLGLICPVMSETDLQVQIQHGNTLMWVDKDKTSKVLGTMERREPQRKWDALYRNPLLKPHRP